MDWASGIRCRSNGDAVWSRLQNRFPGVLGNSTDITGNYEQMQLSENTIVAPLASRNRPPVYTEPPLYQPLPADTIATVQYQPTPSEAVPPAPAGDIQPVSATTAPTPNFGVIMPRLVSKIGHEKDFSWITGQLGQQNGQWVIFYATPGTVDDFGGKLVLNYHGDMTGLQAGDLICVWGKVAAAGVYQVNTISVIRD